MWIQKMLIKVISIIFLITVLYKTFQGNGEHQLILISGFLLCYLPWAYEKLFKVTIPQNGQLATTLFIFASQYLGTYVHFYGLFSWWDRALHFISGFLLAYWGLVLTLPFDREGFLFIKRKIGLIVLIAFLSGSASAAIWEILEFLGDNFLGTFAQLGSLSDTMEDMICGTIGGGLFALYVGLMMIFHKKSCIDTLFSSQIGGKKAK